MKNLVSIMIFLVGGIFVLLLASGFQVSESSVLSQAGNGDTTQVVLLFGGDVLLAEYYTIAAHEERGSTFRDAEILRQADVAMVNLESPITTRGTKQVKPFTFRMHPRFLDELTMGGIDIVNIANNHIHDYDDIGLFDTISYLDSVGIKYVGAGRNAEQAHRPVLVSRKGWRIAFLGYYGGGEAPAATRTKAGVAARRLDVIRRDIQSLRDTVDYIIINFHWGTEKATQPDQSQISFARSVIDAGADAIVGHHPHVLQGIELYRERVIAYSLGNLVFGGNSRHSYYTGLLEIRLRHNGSEFRFVPIHIAEWRAREISGETADSLVSSVRQLSSVFPFSIFSKE